MKQETKTYQGTEKTFTPIKNLSKHRTSKLAIILFPKRIVDSNTIHQQETSKACSQELNPHRFIIH